MTVGWAEGEELLALPQFSSVQSLSRVGLFATPRTAACQASLSITTFRSLLKLMPNESVMPSNHLNTEYWKHKQVGSNVKCDHSKMEKKI